MSLPMILDYHGQKVRVPQVIVDLGVIESTYLNDASPSVMFPRDGEDGKPHLQVFLSTDEGRVEENFPRFHIWVHDGPEECWLNTDDPMLVVAYIRGFAAAMGYPILGEDRIGTELNVHL